VEAFVSASHQGKKMSFEAPWPADFQTALTALRLKKSKKD
jgi:hypothetical protein